MPYEQCQHGQNAPVRVLDKLHDSQAGAGRHKCTNCAYVLGFLWGQENEDFPTNNLEQCQAGLYAPRTMLSQLPDSQAGLGRHKCPICSFHRGFEDAQNKPHTAANPRPTIVLPPLIIGELKQSSPPEFKKSVLRSNPSFKGRRNVDYRSDSEKNKKLGNVGEALVAKWEKEELIRHGRTDLAKMVEIVADTQGDGLGYDVKSFTPSGEEKFIEVKTTTGSIETPFYLSANELAFSKLNPQKYFLLRVYDYKRLSGIAQFYVVSGDIEAAFNLSPSEYRVSRC